MPYFIKNIVLQTISLLLISSLLFPFAVKLDHVLDNHNHTVCNSKVDKHVHENEVDCDFFDYKINQLGLVFLTKTYPEKVEYFSVKNFAYKANILASNTSISYLRGPPNFV